MWKPSRYKPKTVEAMQFSYTAEGITAMKEWVGDGKSWKFRHIGAVGYFEFPSGLVAAEGDYIVKNDSGFTVMEPNEFEKLFVTEHETTTDNSYEP